MVQHQLFQSEIDTLKLKSTKGLQSTKVKKLVWTCETRATWGYGASFIPAKEKSNYRSHSQLVPQKQLHMVEASSLWINKENGFWVAHGNAVCRGLCIIV